MAIAAVEKEDTLGGIKDLLELLGGKPGSTTTTKSDISSEGITSILSKILESNQGLATVASGQKAAGLYNSTSNRLLINDLLARTSGEAAARQAATTQTTTNASPLSTLDTKSLLAALAAAGAKSAMSGGGSSGGGSSSATRKAAETPTNKRGMEDESSFLDKIGNVLKDPFGAISELFDNPYQSSVLIDTPAIGVDSLAKLGSETMDVDFSGLTSATESIFDILDSYGSDGTQFNFSDYMSSYDESLDPLQVSYDSTDLNPGTIDMISDVF